MRIVFPDGAACMQDPAGLEPLRRLGQVDCYDAPPPDKATLIDRLRPAEAVVLDYSLMDAEVLRACERLRFISFLGIGYASCIDVDEATRRGVAIAYTPDYGATSVAEHALGMILAATRHIGHAFVSFREGRWEPGRFVGMELLGWTRRATPERAEHGLAFVSLEELFSRADIVSLHLSYRPETHGLVSRALLGRMKPTAWFVNTARAKLVDNAALAELLAAGKIAGAALDVHEEEPPRGEYVFRSLPNVLITPHIGYNTHEASANMLRIAIDTVLAYARGERLHVVNGV